MTKRGRFVVPPDHPCLPGHFPGQPVVPGVVLLDHVLDLLLAPGAVAATLNVRFIGEVGPGEAIEVSAPPGSDRLIRFSATRDGEPVLRGTIELAP